MKQNRKGEAGNFTSKTDYLNGRSKAFSVSDYNTGLVHIAQIINRVMKPGKVIRLYRCFACKRNFPISRMTSALIICRECLKRTQAKGRLASSNEIDRITTEIGKFLRGWVQTR